MRRGVAVALALLLVGCGKTQEAAENQPSASEKPVAASSSSPAPAPAASASRNASESALGALPPADAALRFVGTWAKSRSECASAGWHFTADKMVVAGGPSCSLYKVSKVPGGYDLAAQCPEKKPDPTDLIKLRFAESARAMLVESNAIAPMGLIYCGK